MLVSRGSGCPPSLSAGLNLPCHKVPMGVDDPCSMAGSPSRRLLRRHLTFGILARSWQSSAGEKRKQLAHMQRQFGISKKQQLIIPMCPSALLSLTIISQRLASSPWPQKHHQKTSAGLAAPRLVRNSQTLRGKL